LHLETEFLRASIHKLELENDSMAFNIADLCVINCIVEATRCTL